MSFGDAIGYPSALSDQKCLHIPRNSINGEASSNGIIGDLKIANSGFYYWLKKIQFVEIWLTYTCLGTNPKGSYFRQKL